MRIFPRLQGGAGNDIQGNDFYSVICGGEANTNKAGAWYGTILGGYHNIVAGPYSLAAGWQANAMHAQTFVWSDGSYPTTSTANNQFMVRCNGGAIFYTGGGTSTGVQLASGGGSWSSLSDRNTKENFAPVDAKGVLERVAKMPITTWNYKAQEKTTRHIGPMAQDFHAAFGVGEDERHITAVDEDGVALRSCGWIWVRNHQAQGCIGCHEDGELTPPNWQVAALWENSVKACPPPEQRISVDFRRDVFPLLGKKCTGCHDKKGSPPTLTVDSSSPATPDAEATARFAYEALLAPDKSRAEPNPYGKYVHPGRARTSPLVWHLLGRNLSRPWDGAAVHQSAKPIPPDRPDRLSAEEQQLFVKWVDLGAPWEYVPAEAAASAGHDAGKQTER